MFLVLGVLRFLSQGQWYLFRLGSTTDYRRHAVRHADRINHLVDGSGCVILVILRTTNNNYIIMESLLAFLTSIELIIMIITIIVKMR